MNRPNVELHIEELELHGFPQLDTQRVASALEAKLRQLLAAEDLPVSFSVEQRIGRLDAGSFTLAQEEGPQSLGERIARSVHGALEA